MNESRRPADRPVLCWVKALTAFPDPVLAASTERPGGRDIGSGLVSLGGRWSSPRVLPGKAPTFSLRPRPSVLRGFGLLGRNISFLNPVLKLLFPSPRVRSRDSPYGFLFICEKADPSDASSRKPSLTILSVESTLSPLHAARKVFQSRLCH